MVFFVEGRDQDVALSTEASCSMQDNFHSCYLSKSEVVGLSPTTLMQQLLFFIVASLFDVFSPPLAPFCQPTTLSYVEMSSGFKNESEHYF